ncbi:hypothetical protein ACP70R_005250 [Stipagrostis hirtigluma subsp. patula]
MQPCRVPKLAPMLFFLLPLLRLTTLSSAWAPVYRNITVDQQGRGDFRWVQPAVDSVPDGNRGWVRIHVKAGEYREKVTIPRSKEFILLEGEGYWTTQISFDGHAHPSVAEIMSRGGAAVDKMVSGGDGDASTTFSSATFTVLADNFMARDIAFKNTYNMVNLSRPDQAVAALVAGDKAAFHGCAFFGYQDTLCDYLGRHYFRGCYVMGAVDFIFGFGQSIYDGCTVVSNMPAAAGEHAQPGWVTAHARPNASSPGGLVFNGCAVLGTGRQYLGRAWNQHAAVVFHRTFMSAVVVPEGWDAWNAGGNLWQVTFAEDECAGLGANTSRRVAWEKKLSQSEVQRFVDIRFIDDGWLSKSP